MISRRRKSKESSDLARITAWLRGLESETFLALPPASTRGGPYDAADVHVTAAEAMTERGLPVDTPYIGWHSQTEAWDRTGRLVSLQQIYWGGELARVRAALETVPAPFEIGGGESEDQAFHLVRRFDAGAINRSDGRAVEAALDSLHHGHWRDGELRFRLDRALSGSATKWLHSLVTDPAFAAKHRSMAFELLAAGDAVTDAELTAVHQEVVAAYAGPDGAHLPWYAAATSLVPLLVERGRLGEAADLAARATRRHATTWEGQQIALAAPSPQTLAVTEELGLHLAEARIRAALSGTAPRAEAIAVERVRAATGTDPAQMLRDLVTGLPQLSGTPAATGILAPLELSAARCAELLTDPQVPDWLLDRVHRSVAPGLADLRSDGEWAAYSRSPYHGEGRADLVTLASAVTASRQRLADELGDAAAAWEPPETGSKYALWETLDEVRDLTDAQESWFRSTLLEPPAGAASELDAYLLEPLVAGQHFTVEDAEVLLPQWRKRFARKHDAYQPVQPALLSFVLGLQDVDHPQAAKVRGAVLKLKPVWARPIQHVLRAFATEDPRADLRNLVATTHLQQQHGAAMGLVLTEARIAGTSPLAALARLHGDLPRGVDVRLLGLELASAQARLLNDRVKDSPARRELESRVAADASLPQSFRIRFGG